MNGGVTDPSPARTYGGESAEERTARRRRQLLDAGRASFGSVGFRASTVRGICRDAHVADRYFYELFPTLEDLLVEVYRECIATLTRSTTAAVDDLPAGTDPLTLSRHGLDGFFRAVEDRELARIVWLEVLGVSPRVDRTYLDTMHGFGELMVGLLGRHTPDIAVGSSLDRLATAAVGGISHTAMTWLMDRYRADRTDLVHGTARFLAAVVGAAEPE